MLRRGSVSIRLFTPLIALGLLLSPTASADDSPIPDDASSWGSTVFETPTTKTLSPFRGIDGAFERKVDGGVWRYGTTFKVVYSRYYHPTECHDSSVKTHDGFIWVRSRAAAGQWSNTQVRRSTNTNEAFYWFC